MGSSAQQQETALTGQDLVNVFLEELSTFIRRTPDHEFTGTPCELVEEVLLRTTRFSDCMDSCLDTLTKQIAMAVKHKGRPFHLRYEMLSRGRIKVAFA